MCPIHSVCVPLPCGLMVRLLKFTGPPNTTEPIKFPSTTGSILNDGAKKHFGPLLCDINGIDISIHSFKSEK